MYIALLSIAGPMNNAIERADKMSQIRSNMLSDYSGKLKKGALI